MGSTPSAADDVVQDVFVAMMDNLVRYDPDRSQLLHYLFGIARNVIRSRARRFCRREVLVDQLPEGVEEFDPLGGRVRAERCQAVRVALDVLPMKYREVLVLCDMQDLDYAHAAAVLDVPIGTVRSRLHRGRRLLMERIERAGGTAGARGWSWRTIW